MNDYKNDYPASRQGNIKETRESNIKDSYNYAARNNPCLETKVLKENTLKFYMRMGAWLIFRIQMLKEQVSEMAQ